ncbi:MAG: hypothetical protein Q7T03_02220 [Deltaproteobacteria bacterium]|nr:hypothetical protein [Deltaproteobacteria bacterium]
MTGTAKLDLTKFYWGVNAAYGSQAYTQAKKVFNQYGLSGSVDVYQGNVGDGVVLVPYTLKDGGGIQGSLRFAEDGSVYDGNTKTEDVLPVNVGRFLVAVTAGKGELKTPLNDSVDPFFDGAKQIYECQAVSNFQTECVEPLGRQMAGVKTDAAIQFSDALVAKAKSHDEGGWWIFHQGWDVGDLVGLQEKYIRSIAVLSSPQLRQKKSDEMISAMFGLWQGAKACVELGQCRTQVVEGPSCRSNETPQTGTTYYYGDTIVRNESGYCEKPEKPEKEPKCFGRNCL